MVLTNTFHSTTYSSFWLFLCLASSNVNVVPFSACKIQMQPTIPQITSWLVCLCDSYPLICIDKNLPVPCLLFNFSQFMNRNLNHSLAMKHLFSYMSQPYCLIFGTQSKQK